MRDTYPLVTILVLCYNFENYIADCLSSIINQTYDNIELIVLDDCSTDATVNIIKSFEPRIQERGYLYSFVFNPKNEYSSENWNKQIVASKGEYFKFMDGDDFLFPDCIEVEAKYLFTHPRCGLVHTDFIEIGSKDHYNDDLSAKPTKRAIDTCENMAQRIYEKCDICSPTVLRRKAIYDKIGLYDERLKFSDWGNYIDTALYFDIGCVHRATAAYRVLGNSASHFANDDKGRAALLRMVKSEMLILDKYLDDNRIVSRPGINTICNQAMSIAIDIKCDEVIDLVKKYLHKTGCKLNMLMTIKLFLYKKGIWKDRWKIR